MDSDIQKNFERHSSEVKSYSKRGPPTQHD